MEPEWFVFLNLHRKNEHMKDQRPNLNHMHTKSVCIRDRNSERHVSIHSKGDNDSRRETNCCFLVTQRQKWSTENATDNNPKNLLIPFMSCLAEKDVGTGSDWDSFINWCACKMWPCCSLRTHLLLTSLFTDEQPIIDLSTITYDSIQVWFRLLVHGRPWLRPLINLKGGTNQYGDGSWPLRAKDKQKLWESTQWGLRRIARIR